MVVEDFYRWLFLGCFGSRSPNKEARATCCNIVTTLLVCLFDELQSVWVVEDYAFNRPDRANEIHLWGLSRDHQVMEKFVKEHFTGHLKFHTQMVMFVLETRVPRGDLRVFPRHVPILVLYLWLSKTSCHQWALFIPTFVLWKLPLD